MKTLTATAFAAALALTACSAPEEISTLALEPSPTETTAANSSGEYTGNDPFCLALFNAFEASSDAQEQMSNVMSGLSDPAALASGDVSELNALGRELADLAAHQGAFYTDALNATDDPEVREELAFFIEFVERVVLKMGQAAADATSIEDYATRLQAVTADPQVMEMSEQSNTAFTKLGVYAESRCSE